MGRAVTKEQAELEDFIALSIKAAIGAQIARHFQENAINDTGIRSLTVDEYEKELQASLKAKEQ